MDFKACTLKEIPAFGNMSSDFGKLILNFINTGAEAAEIDPHPYGLASASSNLRRICYTGKVPVRVAQRNKQLYLIRTDLEMEARKNG